MSYTVYYGANLFIDTTHNLNKCSDARLKLNILNMETYDVINEIRRFNSDLKFS